MPKENHVLQALEKFESKIDKLDSRLDSIEKVQIKQEANLGEHMRRTDLAEKNMDSLRADFKPIQKHVAYMEGALKGFGLVAMCVAIGAGIVKIIQFFH